MSQNCGPQSRSYRYVSKIGDLSKCVGFLSFLKNHPKQRAPRTETQLVILTRATNSGYFLSVLCHKMSSGELPMTIFQYLVVLIICILLTDVAGVVKSHAVEPGKRMHKRCQKYRTPVFYLRPIQSSHPRHVCFHIGCGTSPK